MNLKCPFCPAEVELDLDHEPCPVCGVLEHATCTCGTTLSVTPTHLDGKEVLFVLVNQTTMPGGSRGTSFTVPREVPV